LRVPPSEASGDVTVVIATRERRERLARTLDRLESLPRRPPVIVVDNGSSAATLAAVRARAGSTVRVLALGENRGAAARTAGVDLARTPYVAFADDDSWWAPGALPRAARHLDRHPRVGVLAARILVGDDEHLDPTCTAMADSPLVAPEPLPGPALLGFVACGAVVRRDAYLAVGGFDRRFGVGGEEALLAIDLAAAGWWLAYAHDVVAHHHPSPADRRPEREDRMLCNDLWCAALRRPGPAVLAAAARAVRARRPRALLLAARGAPWVLRERRVVPAHVERQLRLLEG
jgi:N-acetylglucosaminyl-diphospho-decaprenol L-rhamnosyltransferase